MSAVQKIVVEMKIWKIIRDPYTFLKPRLSSRNPEMGLEMQFARAPAVPAIVRV